MTVWGIIPNFSGLSPCRRQIAYALRTRSPVVSEVQALPVTPRLACVKPAASVHPEPGSNSSLLFLNIFPQATKIDMVKMVLFTCIFRYALSFFIFILSMNFYLQPNNKFVQLLSGCKYITLFNSFNSFFFNFLKKKCFVFNNWKSASYISQKSSKSNQI